MGSLLNSSKTNKSLLFLLVVILAACGSAAGQPCEMSGSGFTMSDNCRHKCLALTTIVCPDESRDRPALCSGPVGCNPGSCGNGEVCYTVNDPFEEVSFCIPAQVCSEENAQVLGNWEVFTAQVAAQTRLEHQRRFPSKAVTEPKNPESPAEKPNNP